MSLRTRRQGTVAVLVDVQERLFPHINHHEQLEQNLLILLKGLNILEVPVMVTQQYTRGLGETIPSLQAELGQLIPFEKMHFSCCGSPEFNTELEEAETVLLFGIESHVCVLQTALDLLEQGKRVVWVDDCIGSRKTHDKELARLRVIQAGAILSTYESLLLELSEISGTPEFKAISKLIR